MELTYRTENGYQLPNLEVPEAPKVGKYGMLRRSYLANHKHGIYMGMLMSAELNSHLEEIDRKATEMVEHLTVKIKTCDAISSPMAYGLLWPVVLLPKNTDWSDEDQLTYVLTHEYVHIRRGDFGWKLLLTAALCVHWFNPLVWIMYFRANQDLELACDEAVVRILGLDNRKNYAYALLTASESAFSPLCITYATKNHMEERIRAIMKMKKKSTAVIICAAMLVAGITAVFATSPKPVEVKNIEDLPSAAMTNTTTPTPALGEQDVPQTIPEHIYPTTSTAPDTSIASQTGPAVPGQDTEPVDESIKPVTEPEPTPSTSWSIPDGPIAAGTVLFAGNTQDKIDMVRYLRAEKGYSGSLAFISRTDPDGIKWEVMIQDNFDGKNHEIKAPEGIMPDWTHPVNSKGETYGSAWDEWILGYEPELISVVASNGIGGYTFKKEMDYSGYQGAVETPEDKAAYTEWCKTQPSVFMIPVYDVDRNNVVGYFEKENTWAKDLPQERSDDILYDLENGLHSRTNLSDEEISKEVQDYKQSHGWN